MFRYLAGLAGAGALIVLGLITAAPGPAPPHPVVAPEAAPTPAAEPGRPVPPPGTMGSGAPTGAKPGEPPPGGAPAAAGTG